MLYHMGQLLLTCHITEPSTRYQYFKYCTVNSIIKCFYFYFISGKKLKAKNNPSYKLFFTPLQ